MFINLTFLTSWTGINKLGDKRFFCYIKSLKHNSTNLISRVKLKLLLKYHVTEVPCYWTPQFFLGYGSVPWVCLYYTNLVAGQLVHLIELLVHTVLLFLVDISLQNSTISSLHSPGFPRLLPISLFLLKKHIKSSSVSFLAVREWWGITLGALVFSYGCVCYGRFICWGRVK